MHENHYSRPPYLFMKMWPMSHMMNVTRLSTAKRSCVISSNEGKRTLFQYINMVDLYPEKCTRIISWIISSCLHLNCNQARRSSDMNEHLFYAHKHIANSEYALLKSVHLCQSPAKTGIFATDTSAHHYQVNIRGTTKIVGRQEKKNQWTSQTRITQQRWSLRDQRRIINVTLMLFAEWSALVRTPIWIYIVVWTYKYIWIINIFCQYYSLILVSTTYSHILSIQYARKSENVIRNQLSWPNFLAERRSGIIRSIKENTRIIEFIEDRCSSTQWCIRIPGFPLWRKWIGFLHHQIQHRHVISQWNHILISKQNFITFN